MNASNEEIRTMLSARMETLRPDIAEVGEPTPDMMTAYQDQLYTLMARTHKTDRGKREVAVELGMTVSQLEGMLIGKSILDIGCGEGKLSQEVARLKKTKVTALDHDPELLDKIRPGKNLTVVEGSGFKLPAQLEGEEFDVVISSFSSVLWARTPEEKSASIRTAVDACKVGGVALLIPVISNPTYRDRALSSVTAFGTLDGQSLDPVNRLYVLHGLYVNSVMDITMFDQLTSLESDGRVENTFVSALTNKSGNLAQERYSAIVDVKSAAGD